MTNDDDDVGRNKEVFECVFVQVYIYDLSQGMARNLGQQLIGRPIEGIWHTAVVVHGKVLLASSKLVLANDDPFFPRNISLGEVG